MAQRTDPEASIVTLYYRAREATHERVSSMATRLGCGPAELLRDASMVYMRIAKNVVGRPRSRYLVRPWKTIGAGTIVSPHG